MTLISLSAVGVAQQIYSLRETETLCYVFGKSDNRSEPVRVYKHIFKALPDATTQRPLKVNMDFLPARIYLTDSQGAQ